MPGTPISRLAFFSMPLRRVAFPEGPNPTLWLPWNRAGTGACPYGHLCQTTLRWPWNSIAPALAIHYLAAMVQANEENLVPAQRDVAHLRDISPQQWKSGIAAWLGWLFDGLDMHLYTLVAAPFVMQLLHVASTTDPLVKEKSSWIQAAFLIGWALGGGFFGRAGRPAGPQPGAVPDDSDLRPVHGPVGLRADLVATADFPFSGRPGHRRRMGGRVVTPVRDLAQSLASLDRRRAADGRQHRRPDRVPGRVPAGGLRPSGMSSSSESCPR